MITGISPYICVRGAAAAIDYYKKVFGATETVRHADPDGRIRHAEIKLGASNLAFTDESPEFEQLMKSVQSFGGSPVSAFVYVESPEEVDRTIQRATDAGGAVLWEIKDQPYGRIGGVTDPWGLAWWVLCPPKEG